jgi:sec-independent protein translocase protein TatB
MFDVGFTEVLLCFIVALVVLGPEKLPKVARTVGRWAGHAKAYMRNLSDELERETQVMDIKRQLQEAQQALKDASSQAEQATKSAIDEASKNVTGKP